jgi:hypothetical protein
MDRPKGSTLHIKVWGVADYVILLSTLYDIIFWFYSLGQLGTRNLHKFESIILVAEFPVFSFRELSKKCIKVSFFSSKEGELYTFVRFLNLKTVRSLETPLRLFMDS